MRQRLAAWWYRAFLAEQPSAGLGLFRLAVGVTVGCHMIPSFVPLADTYLGTAFRELNGSFFPGWALQWVAGHSDSVVGAMVGVFLAGWVAFLIGWRTQASGLVMLLGCYYFYARNALHIGTLSFDILLVTLWLVCITPYPGDAWSLDGWLRERRWITDRRRPVFIQRLLQLQMASTYFYTALRKITVDGNWLTDNPIYYLVHSPTGGVVRQFVGREWLAGQPGVCYAIGVSVVLMELALPFAWFVPRLRVAAVAVGWWFHVMLLATLHVPTIFFFLFPAQMLLFLPPETFLPQHAKTPRP